MIKIVHIITGLGSGGAENMLYKLLKYSDKNEFYHEVISLLDEGTIGKKIKNEGIGVHSLNISKSNIIKTIINARKICKDFDIVSTWLYHADIFGFLISKILLRKKLMWNIRHSNLDKGANKRRTLAIVKINSFLSRYVDYITYNSNKAYETHKAIGYINKKYIIIPNGFELDKFKYNEDSRKVMRESLKIVKDEKVLITVGRWDKQKDYYTLYKALNEIKKKKIDFKLVMVGTNLDYSNKELKELIYKYSLEDNIILLGKRDDIPDLLSAADIYISSSLGESFSNAIGEAMACELPCIVTDVGDSRIIVDKFGAVVSPGDYLSMAEKMINYINNPLLVRSVESRTRIMNNYEITKIAIGFENVYKSM